MLSLVYQTEYDNSMSGYNDVYDKRVRVASYCKTIVTLHALTGNTVQSLLYIKKESLHRKASSLHNIKLMTGIEPVTPSLPRKCSTSEPHQPVRLRVREI